MPSIAPQQPMDTPNECHKYFIVVVFVSMLALYLYIHDAHVECITAANGVHAQCLHDCTGQDCEHGCNNLREYSREYCLHGLLV